MTRHTFIGRKPGPHRTRKARQVDARAVAELLSEWRPLDRCKGCDGSVRCEHLTHDVCRAGAGAARRHHG